MISLRKLILGGALFTLAGAFANATTMTATGLCGVNTTPGATGTFTCGTISSITGGGTFLSGYIVYNSTYQFANTGSPVLTTNFSFNGATYSYGTDTLLTTDNLGQGSSPASSVNGVFSTSTGVLPGFVDNLTSPTGTLAVNFTDNVSGGTVLSNQVNDFAEYVITYSTTATPEPTTMALIGGGLLLVGTLRRRSMKSNKV